MGSKKAMFTKNQIKNLNVARLEEAKKELVFISALTHYFDDDSTYKNNELIDARVLKGILFAFYGNKKDYLNSSEANIVKRFTNFKTLDSVKVKNAFHKGGFMEGKMQFYKVLDSKYSNTYNDTNVLFMKVLTCLVTYFNFDKFFEENKNNSDFAYSLLDRLYHYCIILTLKGYHLEERINHKLEDGLFDNASYSYSGAKLDKKYLSAIKDWRINKFILKDSPLYDYVDESYLEDFSKLYNVVYQNWFPLQFNDGNYDLRNSKEAFEGLELVNDWSYFFEVVNKGFLRADNYEGIIKILENHYDAEILNTIRNMSGVGISGYNNEINRFIDTLTLNIFSKYQREYKETVEKEKLDLLNQIKELKSNKKTLTKDIGVLNSEILKLQSEAKKNEKLLQDAKERELNSEENQVLRNHVDTLSNENKTLLDSNNKLVAKNVWLEKQVDLVTEEMKYYSSIEDDLIVLQNENNVLISQIEEIEALENMENAEEEFQRKLNAIKDEPILFVGGTGSMTMKLQELFPNSELVTLDDGINFTVPNRIKYVAIFTKVISHAYCKRLEALVDKEMIIPLNILNTKLVVEELYEKIVGHKNN